MYGSGHHLCVCHTHTQREREQSRAVLVSVLYHPLPLSLNVFSPIKNILGVIVEAPDRDGNSSAHRHLVPSYEDLNSGV